MQLYNDAKLRHQHLFHGTCDLPRPAAWTVKMVGTLSFAIEARKTRKALAKLEAHELADMGLTRCPLTGHVSRDV